MNYMAKMNQASLDEQQNKNEELDFEYQELHTYPRKASIRIPCEQYAYIEVEVEDTPQNITALYRYFSRLSKGGTGITDKAFNDYIDCYLIGKPIDSEQYVLMNKEQQDIVQTIKRAIKRIKNNQE